MFWQAWVVQVALEHEMELYYTQSERATFLFTHLGRGRKKYFLIRQLVLFLLFLFKIETCEEKRFDLCKRYDTL